MGRLPPLKALRAFEAAARHMRFKAAADELALTPTAISHQIRLLETTLGRALFRRRPRPLTLTPAGAALVPVVRNGFESIAEAFAMARIEDVSRRLEAIDAPGGIRRSPATSDQVDEKPVTASTQPVHAFAIERPDIPEELVPSVLHPSTSLAPAFSSRASVCQCRGR
jgi:Bacterial regulatory helix-turn-helix protein, lysR family